MLAKYKMDQAFKHKKMMESLITFTFPTTEEFNQDNINLKNYEKYFEHQMHIAPSTDQRLGFMTA